MSELVTPTARNGGKPPVQAIYQRAHKHAQRGVWLIPAENLFRYLLSLGASSVEEYEKANGIRDSGRENEVDPHGAVPVPRNAGEKRKSPPLIPGTHTVEDLS